ncbi:hypothetical protein [Streptococcus dentiloxodontae]
MKVYDYEYGANKSLVKLAVGVALIVTGLCLFILTATVLDVTLKLGGEHHSSFDYFFFIFLGVIVWVFPAYVWYKYRLTKDNPEPQVRVVMELLPDRLLVYSRKTEKLKKEIFYSDLESFHFNYNVSSGGDYYGPNRYYRFKYQTKSETFTLPTLDWSKSYWAEEKGQKVKGYALAQTILDFVHEKMGMTFDYPTIDWAQVSQLKVKISKESLVRQLTDSVTKLFHQGESVRTEVYAVITSDGIEEADVMTQRMEHYVPGEIKNLTVDWGEAVFDDDNLEGDHLLPRISFLYDNATKELNVEANMYFELDDGTRFIPQTNAQLADFRKGIFKLLGVENSADVLTSEEER